VNRPKWQAVGILLAVFVLGTVTGGAAMAAWHGKQRRDVARLGFGPHGVRPLLAMARRLDLSHEQRQSIETLLEKHGPQHRAILREMMAKCGEGMQKEKAQLDSEIRAILTAEQQKHFDELSSRQRERLLGPPGPRRDPAE
jgi:Spy/CpxP family protein refolding chaperone